MFQAGFYVKLAGKTKRSRLRRVLQSTAVLVVATVALLFVGNALGVREISIDELGFLPGVVNADGPQDLRWTNNTQIDQSVISSEGLFDSGTIPSGGGYSMKLQVPGVHHYTSNATNRQGTIVVPLHTLPGGSTDPVAEHIPDLEFPPVADGDVMVDPRWGVPASRTRILLGFKPGVTVGQANAALAAAHATIIGGLPDVGILLAQAQESPVCTYCDSFYYLKSALTSFRADPNVDFASMSLLGTGQSVPRGAGDSATQDDPKFPGSGWTWRTTDTGGNWGLKAARFPQAWNFLESIRRKSPTAITGIVDGGFDSQHPDLEGLKVAPKVCTTGGTCRTLGNEPTFDHGTLIAGIIGAAYDNDLDAEHPSKSRGVSGANPVSSVVAYPSGDFNIGNFFGNKEAWIADKELELFTMILSSASDRPQVLNYSSGTATFIDKDDKLWKDSQGRTIWWKNFPNKTCGPGADDDESPTSAGTQLTCTPDNEDGWLKEMGQIGRSAARVAKLASQNKVMIVQAAGNDSWFFCNPPSDDCHAAIRAESRNEFAWASANWSRTLHLDEEGLTDPILAVEATVPPSQKLAQFSNYGGDIAAPGFGILSTVAGSKYGAQLGTSMAAPYVAALVGYLLADDPSLTLAQLRHRVLDYAAPPITGSISAPRLDAFASMLAGPGAAKRLVDVNDYSDDGDRRVIRTRNDDGTIGEIEDGKFSPARGEETAPDGFVDMRDFRRFRDAYLQVCATGAGDPLCPAASDIELDGGDSSPKKDLNFDHCVAVEPANPDDCDAHEKDFSRFDFNGDGQISVGRHALVPLTEDGQPVAKIADGAQLSDLDVLQSQWSPNPKRSEGWGADDLMSLVRSADLELHADTLFDLGASKAEVQVRTAGDNSEPVGPKRIMKRGDGPAIVTIPLGDDLSREYEVVTTAKTLDGEAESVSQQLKLSYGDDRRVDLCPGTILEADPTRIAADGNSRSTIRLELSSCEGTRDVANKPITWGLSPSTGGASLDLVPAKTDGDGKAVARFLAGATPATYTIEATVDLGGGDTESKTVTIRTVPKLTIKYAWRQVYEDFNESGSTRWQATNPLMPDCTIPGVVEYCIDSWHVQLSQQDAYGAKRDGTLVGGASNFRLTEAASGTFGETTDSWTTSKPDGTTHFADDRNQWLVTDPNAYQDYGVKGLTADEEADGLHLSNLDAVGKLPYHYALVSTRTGGQVYPTPIELGSLTTSMLMVPQDDGGQIRFAAGPGKDIVFERNADGTLKPFQSCGRLDQDLTTEPGYYVATTSDYIPGAMTLKRKPDYTGGDRPMPVGPGHLRIRYEFAAVATYLGQTSPDPQLPDCTQNHPPAASFTFTPQSPDEGHQVHFEDSSTDTENDISKWEWSFGDGTSDSGPNPWHIFQDNGAYDVTLTVTDKDGATDSATQQVVVANLPPEAELDDAFAPEGQPLLIHARLLDAGGIDKAQLHYSITSPNKAWPELSGTVSANIYPFLVPGLPAGAYPLTLTVTDKDGAVTTVTALAVVDDEAPPPPLRATSRTCDPTVTLDAEETRFLDEVNEYRAQNGLDPVAVSPTLNRAAEEHADDMATHGFLSHTGSDGSMPWDRAWRAGYPKTGLVSENAASGSPSGHDALWAWRGSTHGHNENMLDPRWRAVGIARQQGSGTWYWSTSYGDVLDCPLPSAPPAQASLAKTAATDALDEAAVPESGDGVEIAAVTRRTAVQSDALQTTAPATPQYPPTPAFTISKSDPISGHPVTFTNRSRDSLGNPIGATIGFGDGSAPRSLAPNESTQFTYDYASGFNVEVIATDSTGKTASVRRYTEVSDPPQPWLTYTGQTEVVSGSTLAAKVRVTTSDGGDPLPGMKITFKLAWDNAHSATAVTDADGVASADVPLDGLIPDNYYLSIQFDGTPDWSGVWISTPVNIIGNHPPTAHAGGPYVVGFGHAPLLDGSGSSDPDPYDSIASYQWDLDGDGAYDDAAGKYPPLNWDDVSTLVCGGTCEDGHEYPIGLRVTDTRGESSTAQTTARFASDFTLMLGGDNRTVVPGKSNSFAVSVIAAGSFTDPVTLSVEGLPNGITGEFSVNPVEPGHMSVLTLTASDDAQTGQFPVVVSGTGGGVTHTVSDALNVSFGLIPICYGTVTGTVKDVDTGEPLAGVKVDEYNDGQSILTDASGRFTFHNAHLGDSNAPLTHYVHAKKGGWWEADGNGLVACGGTTTIDMELLKKKRVQLSGKVVEGELDPVDHHVVPTDRSIANANVWASNVVGSGVLTDADGKWSSNLDLGPNNTPLTYALNASAAGYWQQSRQVTADTDLTDLNFALVKKCFGTMKGGVVTYADNGAPAPYHGVELRISGSERYFAQTDANGVFTFDRQVSLGYNNTPVSYQLTPEVGAGDPPGSGGEPRSVTFANCGDERSIGLSILRAEMKYAWLEGHVTDDRTHEPVAGVTLSSLVPSQPPVLNTTTTDDTGYYKIQVGLGYGVSSAYASVAAAKQGYEGISGAGLVSAGQVGHADIQMHRPLTADHTLTGLVRDAATGAPISGAFVSDGCYSQIQICVNTGTDGRYTKTLTLDDRIGSLGRYVTASADGYWSHAQSVTLPPNETTTLNFELVHKCDNATVSGTVVDAQTQLPIEGALVVGGGAVSYADAFGHFRLEHIEPGIDNAPLQVAITASALGYYSQTKTVTVFCGANLIVDFGKRETSLGTIAGTITDAAGQPMANVFVGSEFGGSATTDANGNYQINAVPLGDLNSDRAWDVTAIPDGFQPQTKTVIAKANVTVRADFVFSRGNHPPTAVAQTLETHADTALPVTLAGADPDGDTITYAVVANPQHGTLTGSAPALTYTPHQHWTGTDTFEFVTNDGLATSDHATVSIDVQQGSVNAPPSAADDTATVAEDGSKTIDVLANDSPGVGDTTQHLTATLLDQPQHGFALATVGGIAYAAVQDYHGPDTFTYLACDDGTPSACAPATVSVTVTPVNDRPDAADGALALDEDAPPATIDLGALVSDIETSKGNLEYEIVDGPAKGKLTAAGPIVHYDSNDNANGGDSFTYRVVDRGDPDGCAPAPACDGALASEVRTIHITIAPVNDAPTVTLDAPASLDEGGSIDLAAHAADADGDPMTFAWHADGGTLVANGDKATLSGGDGPGTITVTVTAGDGSATDDAEAVVSVANVAPTVHAGDDVSAPWGIPIAFAGTVTDPSGADTAAGLQPIWTFGDGTTAVTGLDATHGYAQTGSYTASLGATDRDGGHSSDDVAVQITRRHATLALEGQTPIPYGTTTLSARLRDTDDAATALLGGREVAFDVAGSTYRAQTDASGIARATMTSPLPPGTYALTLRFDGDALYLSARTSATLSVAAVSTAGLVTGGSLRSSANGRGGFNVHSDGKTVKGELQYSSPTAGNFHASTLTALGVARDGRSAWFAGVGDDGRPFVAYVEDNGEPGTHDVWRLWIAGRLETDGTLLGGNIQIHA